MKHLDYLLAFLLIVPCASYAQIREKLKVEDNGYEWIKLSDGKGHYGAKLEFGRTLIPLSRNYSLVWFNEGKGITGVFYVEKNGYEGACDINGREIIAPNKYESVCFREEEGITGYYSVKKNGYEGACDINGREIIAPNKYESVCFHESEGITGYYSVKKNGYAGACDINGREIIAPNLYESILYFGGKWKFYDKSRCSYVEIKQISQEGNIVESSAKPATSTQKPSRVPIMSGIYVRSGQGYCWETMQFTPPSSDWTLSVEFYDDHIVVGGEWCDYKKTNSSGIKYYTGSYCTFTVSPNYVMSCIAYGMYTIEYKMTLQGALTPGEEMQTVIRENFGTGGVTVTNECNSQGSTSGVQTSGVNTRTPKTCGLCGGKGWIVSTKGVPDFGTGNVWCKECNQSVPPNHYHETCPSCNGKGSW